MTNDTNPTEQLKCLRNFSGKDWSKTGGVVTIWVEELNFGTLVWEKIVDLGRKLTVCLMWPQNRPVRFKRPNDSLDHTTKKGLVPHPRGRGVRVVRDI